MTFYVFLNRSVIVLWNENLVTASLTSYLSYLIYPFLKYFSS